MKRFYTLLLIGFMSIILQAQPVIDLELFASGFSSPVEMVHAGDDRFFVVEKNGVIKILNSNGTTNADPFLDISGIVIDPTGANDERGLLGLAFHPDYANNGYFYVNYINNAGNTQVSRFSVTGDPEIADPGSELPIIDYNQPFQNHNGGCLRFGPDGYLWIASGDGGSGGDPGNRAQNTALLLGKLLRIDVDNPGGGNNYGIPADNPFAGSVNDAEEIWAYGLRNPWKFAFDADNNEVWIADVGQGDVEEINRQSHTAAGLNYGWRCYEGSVPFNTTGCPPVGDLTFPEAEYSSSSGSGNCSVTGGYVYRGSMYPGLTGLYFSADLCSGRIFTVDQAGDIENQGSFGGTWVSFGEDINGELYIMDIGGDIYRIEDDNLSVPDLEANPVILSPNPATSMIRLQTANSEIAKVVIYGIDGSLVLDRTAVGSTIIELSVASFRSGIYLVNIEDTSGNIAIKKLVVQ